MIEYCEVIKILVLITIIVLHLMRYCKFLRFSVCFFFFCWVSGIQLRSVVEDVRNLILFEHVHCSFYFIFLVWFLFFLENRQHVHSHSWCTKTLFTSYYRTDDIERTNNAIQQWKTMGKIPARGFITRLYSATVPTVSRYGKKNTLIVRS